jgi:protein arginine N-methyltransferase 1
MTRNNMYVFAIEPRDLGALPAARWDTLDFRGTIDSRRAGAVSWAVSASTPVYGFALWWECALAPGITLSTSPHAPRTHWDQIYLPLAEPFELAADDELGLELVSETGGDDTGIDVRWTVQQVRAGGVLQTQKLSIGAGFLG